MIANAREIPTTFSYVSWISSWGLGGGSVGWMANSNAVAHAGWDCCEVVVMNLRVLVYEDEGMAYHGAAGHYCPRYGNRPCPTPTPYRMNPQQPRNVNSKLNRDKQEERIAHLLLLRLLAMLWRLFMCSRLVWRLFACRLFVWSLLLSLIVCNLCCQPSCSTLS